MTNIKQLRNIGISAHIDSGKTTLTERILFYCDKIHQIHEVKGKDGVGATMDSMELERERGITIASASTNVSWQDHDINIIDTPGHVDFTIEVERSLRVLDGGILVLCSVGGVQSQSITVDRQLKRYSVPRLAFINKCDRVGANPDKVLQQLHDKLGLNAVYVNFPIGLESNHEGVVDLVQMRAVYFDGEFGENLRYENIPAGLQERAQVEREKLLDAASMFSDELAEAILEGNPDPQLIRQAIRKGTMTRELCPVFVGSAYKNRGVQELLNGVISYLPGLGDIEHTALDLDKEEALVGLSLKPDAPTVLLAFKLEDGQYGQLTYVRVYQGELKKGMNLVNSRSRQKLKVGRLVRMHASIMEDISSARTGDIVALFGVDCNSGDTFCASGSNYSMISMYVPIPVISLAISVKDKSSSAKLAKALNRFTKEDPTFRSYVDSESNETIIQGMGELHLDVYIERIRREYKAEIIAGAPQVSYRETITRKAEFNYTHKKQTGGSGQFGRIAGYVEPSESGEYEFVNSIKGGSIPTEYIPSCNKGFTTAMKKGTLVGAPVVGVYVLINDGSTHQVDSSDQAFQAAAIGAFRECYEKASPVVLEPIMRVTVETPSEFQGNVFATLNQRRGVIISSYEDNNFSVVEADIPLKDMFGYSTVLRSTTQGQANFSMEFLKYGKVPRFVAEELRATYLESRRAGGG